MNCATYCTKVESLLIGGLSNHRNNKCSAVQYIQCSAVHTEQYIQCRRMRVRIQTEKRNRMQTGLSPSLRCSLPTYRESTVPTYASTRTPFSILVLVPSSLSRSCTTVHVHSASAAVCIPCVLYVLSLRIVDIPTLRQRTSLTDPTPRDEVTVNG